MRPRDHIRTLADVVQVRGLQRLKAEAQVAGANLRMADLSARLGDQEGRLQASRQGWAQSLGAQRIMLEVTRSWSQAVHSDEHALAQISAEQAEAERERAAAREQWRTAIARADAADDRLSAARRALARHRENAAVDAAADRTTNLWRRA